MIATVRRKGIRSRPSSKVDDAHVLYALYRLCAYICVELLDVPLGELQKLRGRIGIKK